MDFDWQWMLFAIPATFALGWIAARLDLRQLRRENREAPRAYFRGLSLLLNEQQDKAVDAFIEAVQNDPDTVELHFALGNLFRRRGEFERAVRVHEHLLARADLAPADRARARHALAQDFMRAGLFDRAEAAFRELQGTAFEGEAQLALLSLYERSREWPAALETAARLEAAGRGDFASRRAHYACELAQQAEDQGREEDAQRELERARAAQPQAARPLVMIGQRRLRAGDAPGAMQAFEELLRVAPASFGLVAQACMQAAAACGRLDAARAELQALQARAPSMAVLRALLQEPGGSPAQQPALLAGQLQRQPTLSAAEALLAHPPAVWGEAGLAGIRAAVAQAAGPLQRYRCAACGFEARHWFWQCPGCLGWDSFPPRPVEEL